MIPLFFSFFLLTVFLFRLYIFWGAGGGGRRGGVFFHC